MTTSELKLQCDIRGYRQNGVLLYVEVTHKPTGLSVRIDDKSYYKASDGALQELLAMIEKCTASQPGDKHG